MVNYENIDKYGHCVFCHKNMIIQRVIDQKVMLVFLPDKDETEFLLDDGSKMRVSICKGCKESVDFSDPDVQKNIMEAVVNGWQIEVDSMVADDGRKDWTKKKGEEHMALYRKKSILVHSHSGNKEFINKKIKEIARGTHK